jgi:hypothetical protein
MALWHHRRQDYGLTLDSRTSRISLANLETMLFIRKSVENVMAEGMVVFYLLLHMVLILIALLSMRQRTTSEPLLRSLTNVNSRVKQFTVSPMYG